MVIHMVWEFFLRLVSFFTDDFTWDMQSNFFDIYWLLDTKKNKISEKLKTITLSDSSSKKGAPAFLSFI
ncbi:MAG TPA: hypothetical protein DEF79_14030 [Gammaproteobacteria bacterium]|nr:hypothetical protein [Gammaproteobacteria bacterium]